MSRIGLSSLVSCTVQYSTVQYSTVQYCTVQYSTVQYSTVRISCRTYAVYKQYRARIGSSVAVSAAKNLQEMQVLRIPLPQRVGCAPEHLAYRGKW
jgi:hypothetical protein